VGSFALFPPVLRRVKAGNQKSRDAVMDKGRTGKEVKRRAIMDDKGGMM